MAEEKIDLASIEIVPLSNKKMLKGTFSVTDQMIGCSGLIVDSNSNPKTVRFYKNFGFEEIIKEEDDGEETIKMFFKLLNTTIQNK